MALDAEVSERLEGFNGMKQGRLKVIGNAPQPALRIIARFRQRFPEIRIDFGLHDWTTATSMIANRLTDVGLITDAPENDAWERIHIERMPYVVYCRSEHPLSKSVRISLRDLADETVILPEKGSLTRRLDAQTCRLHDITLNRVVTMTSFPLMCEAVLQGIGVAVFLKNSTLINENLCEIALREMPEPRSTSLIATKDRARLRLVEAFINASIS